jgi:hypothetical protein
MRDVRLFLVYSVRKIREESAKHVIFQVLIIRLDLDILH